MTLPGSRLIHYGLTVAVIGISLSTGNLSAAFAWGMVLYLQRGRDEREAHYRRVLDTARNAVEAEEALYGDFSPEPDPTPQRRRQRRTASHLRVVGGGEG